jgi:hypothetical protein
MVASPKEHEAAWPHHRFELGPGCFDIFACGERPVRVFVESSELLFKCHGNLIEGLLSHHLNVFHRDASDIHRMIPFGRKSGWAVKNTPPSTKADGADVPIVRITLIFFSPLSVSPLQLRRVLTIHQWLKVALRSHRLGQDRMQHAP